MTQQLSIDWTACDGRGFCSELLPELLEADPWGYPQAKDGHRRRAGRLTDVPQALDAPARRAVHLCPRLALELGQ